MSLSACMPLALALALAGSRAGEELEAARRLVDVELRFKEAIEVLEHALADPKITQRERKEAYLLLGIAHVARGGKEGAEAAFSALLDIEPDYQLDASLSPKIARVFEKVRDRRARLPRILELTAVRAGDNVSFTARVADADDRLASIVLYTRANGQSYREQVMDREGDRVNALVAPPAAENGTPLRVEYYVVGKDAGGAPIARVSDAANPSAVIVEKPRIEIVQKPPDPDDRPNAAPIGPVVQPIEEDTPWYASWWFWTIAIGAVAAGTTIVVITRPEPDAPMGTLDPIKL